MSIQVTDNQGRLKEVITVSAWGTSIDTNSGNKSANTLRIVIATDQPQLTNKLLITADPITFATPQHTITDSGSTTVITGTVATNITQIAGSSISTAATGIIKVGLCDGSGNAITSTSNAIDVNIKSGSSGFSVVDESAFTAGSSSLATIGGVFNDSLTSLTTNQAGVVKMSSNRNIYTTIRDAARNERGANVTAANELLVNVNNIVSTNADETPGSTSIPTKILIVGGKTNDVIPQYQAIPLTATGSSVIVSSVGGSGDNIAQWNGNTVDTNSGNTSAGTLRVIIATDQPSLTNAQPINVKQINGSTVVSVVAGVQKVSISDVSGNSFLSAANALNSTGTGVQATQIIGQFDDVAPTTITENQFGNLRMSNNRNLYTTLRDAAGNERGANITAANELLVSINNSTIAVTQSGTWTINSITNAIITNADTTIGGTTAPSKLLLVGGKTADVTPAYDPLPLAAGGGSLVISGTVNQGGSNWSVNIAQINGGTTSTVATGVIKVGIADSSGNAFLSAANALNSTGTGIETAQLIGQFDDVAPTTITENQFGNIRMSTNRNLYQTIRDAAGNERGANVTAANELLTNVNNTVTVGTHAVTQSGTWNIGTLTGITNAVITNADTTISGTAAPTKMFLIGGKTNDGTPQYQPIPLNAGGAAVLVSSTGASDKTQATTLSAPGDVSVSVGSCAVARLTVTGTFTGVSFKVQAQDAAGNWSDVDIFVFNTDVPVTAGTAISSTGNWYLPCGGYQAVRAHLTAILSGSVTFSWEASTAIYRVHTELPEQITLADGTIDNPQASGVWSINMIRNTAANTVYRQIGVINALDQAGPGIIAAGLVAQLDDVSPSTVTENQFGTLRLGAKRSLHTQIRDAAGNDRGVNVNASNQLSVSVDNTPNINTVTSLTQLNGQNITLNKGASDAGTQRVTLGDGTQAIGTVDTELPAAAALSDTIANPTTPMIGSGGMLWNAYTSQWSRSPAPNWLILLASAARTTTTQATQQVNKGHRGMRYWVNVTANSGAIDILPFLIPVQPSNLFNQILWSAAAHITALGTYTYEFYPGNSRTVQTGTMTEALPLPLPYNYLIQINHGNANSVTYSVELELLL